MEQIIHDLFISKKDLIQNNIQYKFLGKGGTGVVYKVTENSKQNEIYAIKIIPKSKFNLND